MEVKTITSNLKNLKRKRIKVSLSDNYEMYKIVKKDYDYLRTKKKITQSTLPTYSNEYLYILIRDFNSCNYHSIIRKMMLEIINILRPIYPYKIDKVKLEKATMIEDWKENGLSSEDIKHEGYYRFVDNMAYVLDTENGNYTVMNRAIETNRPPYIVKIVVNSSSRNDNKEILGDRFYYHKAILVNTINNHFQVFPNQLVDDVSREEIISFEKNRRVSIKNQLEYSVSVMKKNIETYKKSIDIIDNQIHMSGRGGHLLIPETTFDKSRILELKKQY